MQRWMLPILLAGVVVSLLLGSGGAAFAQAPADASLDADLLDGLDTAPLEPAEAAAAPPSGDDPLSQIAARMRGVEQALRQRDVSDATRRRQQEIVADLDALLKQLQQQQKQQQQSSQQKSQQQSQRSQVDNPEQQQQEESGAPAPGDQNSQQAADDSTPGVRRVDGQEVDTAELDALMKAVWGHLPETAREQMRQSSVERFVPKYELLIEKIYRRMATERTEFR